MARTKKGKGISEEYGRTTPVKQQLKGIPCNHPRRARVTVENRKGQKFVECGHCGAFLEWE